MKARMICPLKHRSVILPDTHCKSVIAHRVWCEYLTCQAAIGGRDPLVRHVHLTAKIDHPLDLQFGAELKSRRGDHHAKPARILLANLEHRVRLLSVQVVALATV